MSGVGAYKARPSAANTDAMVMRHAELVTSRRGVEGGYALARPAGEISVADVIRAVEGPIATVRGERPDTVEYTGPARALAPVWLDLRAAIAHQRRRAELLVLIRRASPRERQVDELSYSARESQDEALGQPRGVIVDVVVEVVRIAVAVGVHHGPVRAALPADDRLPVARPPLLVHLLVDPVDDVVGQVPVVVEVKLEGVVGVGQVRKREGHRGSPDGWRGGAARARSSAVRVADYIVRRAAPGNLWPRGPARPIEAQEG